MYDYEKDIEEFEAKYGRVKMTPKAAKKAGLKWNELD